MSSDQRLQFDAILASENLHAFLTDDKDRDRWIYQNAEEMQALLVIDATLRLVHDAVALSATIDATEAAFYLRHGVGRRLKFIWHALRRIYYTAPPQRERPLDTNEVEDLSVDLNVIYINVRGVVDNFSWAVANAFGAVPGRELKLQSIDIFNAAFQAAIPARSLYAACEPFKAWYRAVKLLRDPSAHRIPLSVVPAVLDVGATAEYARYESLLKERWIEITPLLSEETKSSDIAETTASATRIHGQLLEEIARLQSARDRVGRFPSLFVHHPNEPAMTIYPTIFEDVAQLILFSKQCLANLAARRPD
ncbi:hypothetical protein [Falsiroseomonas ponticola]|uniref:hypothetical protein n=1 Tax=Falsiroseomonas ponticola TaxID=2786951 RepID=UPI0019331012|nr:hypothetical protein [Roseomonas ponticola]